LAGREADLPARWRPAAGGGSGAAMAIRPSVGVGLVN
jgi:hypothetical protein